MPAPIDVSSSAVLDKILADAGDTLTVVDFHASWCGPCHAIAPVFARIGAASDANFVRVDVDKVRDLAQRYSVSAMPTFVFLKKGQVVDTLRGADPRGLQRLVSQHSGQEVSSDTVGEMERPSLLSLVRQNYMPIVIAVGYLLYTYFFPSQPESPQSS